MAGADSKLGRWFESHCASYLAVRQKLQDIPVPAGLLEQILSERHSPAPAEAKIVYPVFRKCRTPACGGCGHPPGVSSIGLAGCRIPARR